MVHEGLVTGIYTSVQWESRCTSAILPSIGPVKQIYLAKIAIFTYPSVETCVWVLKRTVSSRRFFWVPTTYVLVEKKEK